jgi:hypothetical protein
MLLLTVYFQSYHQLTADDFPEDFIALDSKPVSGLVAKIKDPLELRKVTETMIKKAIEEVRKALAACMHCFS